MPAAGPSGRRPPGWRAAPFRWCSAPETTQQKTQQKRQRREPQRKGGGIPGSPEEMADGSRLCSRRNLPLLGQLPVIGVQQGRHHLNKEGRKRRNQQQRNRQESQSGIGVSAVWGPQAPGRAPWQAPASARRTFADEAGPPSLSLSLSPSSRFSSWLFCGQVANGCRCG